MDELKDIVTQIELHSVDGIRRCFLEGVDPNISFRDQPLIYELISEYTRSPRFKDCVKVFVDHGLDFNDHVLLSVLLDDDQSLESLIKKDSEVIDTKYSLRCAYTPLYDSSLLHICAEFNHVSCARVLVQYGADVNVQAGTDEYGFGGHTPIFHTVNQNSNHSAEMMTYLLSQCADLDLTVKGLIWGKGYEWETLIPSVNPVSYAMMGLLPQMHRDEETISKTITTLLKHKYEIEFESGNVPNKYLKS